MKNMFLSILTLFFFISCNQSKEQKSQINLEQINTEESFKYRNIIDSVEVFNDREFWTSIYGDWKITSIADVGGCSIQESKIKNQIGKTLTIRENYFNVNFLSNKYILQKPNYEIESLDNQEGQLLKGSSYFNGYQMCRDSVFFVIVNGIDSLSKEQNMYIELITFQEIATYYDGRIYFYERNKKVPNTI